MREFFIPTREKVFFSIAILLIELAITFFYSLYLSYEGHNLASLCMPYLGTVPPNIYQNPHSFSEAWRLANTPNPCGNNYSSGIDSPLVTTIEYTKGLAPFIVSSYVFACIVVLFRNKSKRKKKRGTAPLKK